MQDHLRQSGRTTRMLERAKELAASGKTVYVIAANKSHASQLARQLGGEIMGVDIGGIKVETPSSAGNLDWESGRLIGAHPNCVVLIDHYAVEVEIERRIGNLRRLLHAFDLPAPG